MRKRDQVHETVVSSAVDTTFRVTAILTSPHAKAMARKENRASHGPWSESAGKGKCKKGEGDAKENPMVPRVPKGRTRVKFRKLVYLAGMKIGKKTYDNSASSFFTWRF